jgi:hypothetical protein
VWGIREKTSLLPRSCACPGPLPAVGVSPPTSQPSATGNGSLNARAPTCRQTWVSAPSPAFAGLRLGEASAVNLGDVDFLGRRLHVRRQVQRRRGGPAELRQPKYGSERTIYPPSRLVEMLARHVERAGTAAEGWLFYTSDGRPIPPSTANSWWQFQPTPADQLAHLAVDDLQCTGRSRHGTPVAPPGQDVDGQ